MSKFSDTYKSTIMPNLPLYGLNEIVSYGGFRWEITGFKPNHDDGCWVYSLKRVDGTEETQTGIYEMGLTKGYAMEKSMEEMSKEEKIKFYMQKLGIAGAGPTPNSLLAAQDLERKKAVNVTRIDRENFVTESATKSSNPFDFAVWYYDPKGNQKCAVYSNYIDAEAYANLVTTMGFKDVSIVKGQVEQTGKQLERQAAKAEDAETGEEKTIIDHIKAVQIKRQQATLAARAKEGVGKSFSNVWAGLSGSNQK